MHKDGMPSSPQVQYLLNRAGEPTDCGAMPCVQGRDRRGVDTGNAPIFAGAGLDNSLYVQVKDTRPLRLQAYDALFAQSPMRRRAARLIPQSGTHRFRVCGQQ